MKPILNQAQMHNLLFDEFTDAFQEHVDRQITIALIEHKDPDKVLQSLRTDLQRYLYRLVRTRKQSAKTVRAALRKKIV